MDEAITYNEIDGLVLAVIAGDRQYDVTAWLRCADCYYRVFLSYEELRSALEKLQRGGLIVCKEKNMLHCTSEKTASRQIYNGQYFLGISGAGKNRQATFPGCCSGQLQPFPRRL